VTAIAAVARYTLVEMTRRRLLLALALVALGLITVLGTLPLVLPGMTTPDLKASFMLGEIDRVAGLFLLISGFAIAMTVIYNDLDTGAAVGILVKPVTRLEYALAKSAAAIIGVVLIAATLTVATIAVLLLDGGTGYDYGAVVTSFLAATANTLVLVLLVMVLTVLMNNIVSAVIGFVASQVFGGVGSAHFLVVHGLITASPLVQIVSVAYWVVPHELVSTLPHELRRIALAVGSVRFAGGTSPYGDVPDPTGAGDIAFWAAYCLALTALLYVVMRRRQV
jgi:ABC-type transport system involved in multi-copper enzyme maturation permease subunit